jgi:hypothetical protein
VITPGTAEPASKRWINSTFSLLPTSCREPVALSITASPRGDQVVVGAVLAHLIERVLGREQPVGVGRELAEALRHLAGADLDLRLAGAGLGVQ